MGADDRLVSAQLIIKHRHESFSIRLEVSGKAWSFGGMLEMS